MRQQWNKEKTELLAANRSAKSAIAEHWQKELDDCLADAESKHAQTLETMKTSLHLKFEEERNQTEGHLRNHFEAQMHDEVARLTSMFNKEKEVLLKDIKDLSEVKASISPETVPRIDSMQTSPSEAQSASAAQLQLKLQVQYQEELGRRMDAVSKQFSEQLQTVKLALKKKYKHLLARQKEKFAAEKDDLVDVVKQECSAIIEEARKRRENSVSHLSMFDKGVRVSADGDKEVLIYPEMLSPEVTYELVRSIASRARSERDFKELFDASKSVDMSTNSSNLTSANIAIKNAFSPFRLRASYTNK
jgi:hypothetical protein